MVNLYGHFVDFATHAVYDGAKPRSKIPLSKYPTLFPVATPPPYVVPTLLPHCVLYCTQSETVVNCIATHNCKV